MNPSLVAESRDVLEETDPGSPLYHKFVAGEAPTTLTCGRRFPARLPISHWERRYGVVYGSTMRQRGLATYSSFGVYGDWVTCSCQETDAGTCSGAATQLWNGVVSMTSHDFTGVQRNTSRGPDGAYLYAVKVLAPAAKERMTHTLSLCRPRPRNIVARAPAIVSAE